MHASSWFQVPVLYGWHDLTAHGEIAAEGRAGIASSAATNGH